MEAPEKGRQKEMSSATVHLKRETGNHREEGAKPRWDKIRPKKKVGTSKPQKREKSREGLGLKSRKRKTESYLLDMGRPSGKRENSHRNTEGSRRKNRDETGGGKAISAATQRSGRQAQNSGDEPYLERGGRKGKKEKNTRNQSWES